MACQSSNPVVYINDQEINPGYTLKKTDFKGGYFPESLQEEIDNIIKVDNTSHNGSGLPVLMAEGRNCQVTVGGQTHAVEPMYPSITKLKDSADALIAVAAGLGVPMEMMSQGDQDNVVFKNNVTVLGDNWPVEQVYTEFKAYTKANATPASDGKEPYYHYDWGKGNLPHGKCFDARGVEHKKLRRLNIETGQAVKLTNVNEEVFYLIDKPKVYFLVDQPFCDKPDVEVPKTPARKITVDRV